MNAVTLPHQKPAGSSSVIGTKFKAGIHKDAGITTSVRATLTLNNMCSFFNLFFFFLEKVLLFSVTQKPNRILHTYEGNCPAAKPACLQSGPVPAGGL